MRTSLIYRSSTLYSAAMLGLYGRHFLARYRAVSNFIPAGATVLDLCCGPPFLYRHYLSPKSVRYFGIDLNARFVAEVIRAGGQGRTGDLRVAEFPPADYVLMQASLYHFLPDPTWVIEHMLHSARERVIIAEPVRNLARSRNRLLSVIAARATDTGWGGEPSRFTEATLDAFFERYASRICTSFLIPGGREKVYVLRGSADRAASGSDPH
jgi:hypothetical protein